MIGENSTGIAGDLAKRKLSVYRAQKRVIQISLLLVER
ncbi:hypothetical protein O53_2135 [Microcystis aeruginosa TAIHU98]|uniref:Uncharacterized protein n=1 Tax=Microcystis aeruginosa TAIHU98 TaxID=1134457 RepID=L7E380_MICAE|nr:hypothetical protein O53_2135 [Microcystis aeruginosa TAIHU98]ODV37463.1 hypothetical protein BFG60_3102 [Microcystis aeruginosa NIES-98]